MGQVFVDVGMSLDGFVARPVLLGGGVRLLERFGDAAGRLQPGPVTASTLVGHDAFGVVR